jgi:hypothetical protein
MVAADPADQIPVPARVSEGLVSSTHHADEPQQPHETIPRPAMDDERWTGTNALPPLTADTCGKKRESRTTRKHKVSSSSSSSSSVRSSRSHRSVADRDISRSSSSQGRRAAKRSSSGHASLVSSSLRSESRRSGVMLSLRDVKAASFKDGDTIHAMDETTSLRDQHGSSRRRRDDKLGKKRAGKTHGRSKTNKS